MKTPKTETAQPKGQQSEVLQSKTIYSHSERGDGYSVAIEGRKFTGRLTLVGEVTDPADFPTEYAALSYGFYKGQISQLVEILETAKKHAENETDFCETFVLFGEGDTNEVIEVNHYDASPDILITGDSKAFNIDVHLTPGDVSGLIEDLKTIEADKVSF